MTRYRSEQSLNGTYGGKYAEYIDIKNEVIDTPEHFRSLYFQGFLKVLEGIGKKATKGNPYFDAFTYYKDYEVVRSWLNAFLERTFLRNYDSLTKVRPKPEEAMVWIGQNNASYGLFVTPRFKLGHWYNDESEIRHFGSNYWTIGHVLRSGFVIPNSEQRINFVNVEQYLSFFQNVLVRNSGSVHEAEIANRYCQFVLNSPNLEDVPLLIPELRYNGIARNHGYRLDFTIINPFNMSKVGFELSPWSTHGRLVGIRNKTQKLINEEALGNFEKEMKKLKSYFREYGITVLIFTDSDLKDYDFIFGEIQNYLTVESSPKQLEFQSIENFLSFETPL